MIKLNFVLAGDEAMRWRELLTALSPDMQFPNMSAEDSFNCHYTLHTEDWDAALRKAEAVTFLLRNANIRKIEFDEWDRGTGFIYQVARAHGVLNALYSAIEECPDWIPPPSRQPKGWWRRLREWWNV